MKKLLLLVVISSFAIGMVGCKGSDETPEATNAPSGTAGAEAGTPPPAANPNKAGATASTAPTPQLNGAAANDDRWKANTMTKGGK